MTTDERPDRLEALQDSLERIVTSVRMLSAMCAP